MQPDVIEIQRVCKHQAVVRGEFVNRPKHDDKIIVSIVTRLKTARIGLAGADTDLGGALLDAAHHLPARPLLQVDPQQLVRAEVFRGRFRNSFEKPEPFTPGQPTDVTVPLQDVLHTFKKGHKLMIQVHSTWFPYIDRNPQKYVENIYKAGEKDFIKSTITVYGSSVITAGGDQQGPQPADQPVKKAF